MNLGCFPHLRQGGETGSRDSTSFDMPLNKIPMGREDKPVNRRLAASYRLTWSRRHRRLLQLHRTPPCPARLLRRWHPPTRAGRCPRSWPPPMIARRVHVGIRPPRFGTAHGRWHLSSNPRCVLPVRSGYAENLYATWRTDFKWSIPSGRKSSTTGLGSGSTNRSAADVVSATPAGAVSPARWRA